MQNETVKMLEVVCACSVLFNSHEVIIPLGVFGLHLDTSEEKTLALANTLQEDGLVQVVKRFAGTTIIVTKPQMAQILALYTRHIQPHFLN